MMFKLINKIDNVLRYLLHEKQLIYSSEKQSDGGIIRKMDLLNNELIVEKSTGSALFTFVTNENNFLAKDISGNGLLLNNFLDVLFEIPSPLKVS